jgi:hypothetical protein
VSSKQDTQNARDELGVQSEQAPARDLTREALALPRELDAPPELWAGVEARIARKARHAVLLRRGVTGASVILAAAVVVLAIRPAKQPRPENVTPAPMQSEAVLSPPPPSEPALLVFPEETTYRAALSALTPAFEARKKSLPEKDAAAVSASLRAIDTAIHVTRGSLLESPDDADLRGELDAEYEQEIDTMNDVLAWTTRS